MYYKIDKELLDKKFVIKKGDRHYGETYHALYVFLTQLQFNISSIGFNYWITAIYKYSKNHYKYNTIEKVYEDVAETYGTTRNRVERAMRTAREAATKEIHEAFNYHLKLTNKTVLKLLAHEII